MWFANIRNQASWYCIEPNTYTHSNTKPNPEVRDSRIQSSFHHIYISTTNSNKYFCNYHLSLSLHCIIITIMIIALSLFFPFQSLLKRKFAHIHTNKLIVSLLFLLPIITPSLGGLIQLCKFANLKKLIDNFFLMIYSVQ